MTPQVGDYVQRTVVPRLQAVPGVQTVHFSPSCNMVMRVWLNPERLAAYGLTPQDVSNALGNNNQVTGVDNTLGSSISINLDITSTLHDPGQFRDLIIRQNDLHIIRLGDVARV